MEIVVNFMNGDCKVIEQKVDMYFVQKQSCETSLAFSVKILFALS